MKQFVFALLLVFIASCSSEDKAMKIVNDQKTRSSYVIESLATGLIAPVDYYKSSGIKFRFYAVGDTVVVAHDIITGRDNITSKTYIHGRNHPGIPHGEHYFTTEDSTANYYSTSYYERGVIRAYSVMPDYY